MTSRSKLTLAAVISEAKWVTGSFRQPDGTTVSEIFSFSLVLGVGSHTPLFTNYVDLFHATKLQKNK